MSRGNRRAIQVQDAAYSGAINAASIVAVTGTPAASPAEPAVPANAWVLALVDVPANDTAITNSQITDRRTTQSGQLGRAASLGGVIVCTAASRPAHSEGRVIYETDTDSVLVSDGAAWVPPKNRAGGILGLVRSTSDVNPLATADPGSALVTLPALTLVSGRNYRLTGKWRGIAPGSAGEQTEISWFDSTTVLERGATLQGSGTIAAEGGVLTKVLRCPTDISAGSHTFVLRGKRLTGSSSHQAVNPFEAMIEDIGGLSV